MNLVLSSDGIYSYDTYKCLKFAVVALDPNDKRPVHYAGSGSSQWPTGELPLNSKNCTEIGEITNNAISTFTKNIFCLITAVMFSLFVGAI